MTPENQNLIALEDDQLETVAGGCGFYHRHHGHHGHPHGYGPRGFGAPNVNIDVNVALNVINFQGNVIQSGGDSAVVLSQASAV